MKSSTKAWIFLLGLVAVMIVGVTSVVAVIRFAGSHVPGHAILVCELSGPIAERGSDSPFDEVFGSQTLTRQDLRDAFNRAAADPRIRAVRIRISDPQAALATMQEVRASLAMINRAGKKTFAYMETAGEGGSGNGLMYLASGCSRIVLNPVGEVNLTGIAVRRPFLRGMFDKLGIVPEFVGIGDYKTARFFYTEKDFTPADREMTTWLVESLRGQLAAGIATGRRLDRAVVEDLMRRGPFLADEAIKVGLVDELADWPTFVEGCRKDGARELEDVSIRRYLRADRPDRSGAGIAVVVAEGGIQRGESGFSPVPVMGGDVMGADTIARAFRQVRDSNARAVIFRINSPGGSAVASEVIRAEMLRTAKRIPVIVSMGDVAASGGYWITCGAQKIVANPATITASIGVFSGHFAMEKFFSDKLGVTFGRIESTPNATTYGAIDPWTPEQQAIVQRSIDRVYDNFLMRVSASRKLARDKVDAIGRGRVFTGEQAIGHGLVDVLGGFDVALSEARKAAGLAPDAAVELDFYPRVRPFFKRLFDHSDDAGVRVAATVRALIEGRISSPGSVWMPPLIVE